MSATFWFHSFMRQSLSTPMMGALAVSKTARRSATSSSVFKSFVWMTSDTAMGDSGFTTCDPTFPTDSAPPRTTNLQVTPSWAGPPDLSGILSGSSRSDSEPSACEKSSEEDFTRRTVPQTRRLLPAPKHSARTTAGTCRPSGERSTRTSALSSCPDFASSQTSKRRRSAGAIKDCTSSRQDVIPLGLSSVFCQFADVATASLVASQ
mmetsp:Transcript_29469/g.52756  ORF Transcript_29469/g.52756 Transcript_29469/m.52756 type:complete len:207 (+) Transcript_29469:5095-5715(+)